MRLLTMIAIVGTAFFGVFSSVAAAMIDGSDSGRPECTPAIYGADYYGDAGELGLPGVTIHWSCNVYSAPGWQPLP